MLDSTEQPIGNIIFSRAEGVNIAMNLAGWDEKVAVLADTAAKDAVNGDTDLQKHQKELKQAYTKLYNEQVTYVSNLVKKSGQDALQINDIIFGLPPRLTPPTVIRVDKQIINYKWQTMRNDPQKVSSGHSSVRINLSLYFVGLDSINSGLRRLLATFRALPFVYIENSFLRNNLFPINSNSRIKNMACSLVGISVQTVQGLPNTLVANLDLLWFNYAPYATNFVFRQSWENILQTATDSNDTTINNLANTTEGTNISSAKDNAIQNPQTKNEPGVAYTQPVLIPQNSKPLMDYVDSYMGLPMESMNNSMVFSYREYDSIAGFKQKTNLSDNTVVALDSYVKSMQGRISSNYGPRTNPITHVTNSFHTGVDIAAPLKTPIPSICSGTVKLAGWNNGYGNSIQIVRPDGTIVLYGHCFELNVNVDQKVTTGEIIALMGSTGTNAEGKSTSTGSHLHLEFRNKQGGSMPPTEWNTLEAKDLFPTKIEAAKTNNSTDNAMAKLLDDKIKNGWKVDILASDSIRVLLYKDRTLTIDNYDTQLIPQSIMFSYQNIISEIPIMGQEFPTLQYLGPGDSDAIISFVAIGEDKLRILQEMVTLTQKNARICKGVRDAAVVDIKNSVLNFGNIPEVMVDSIGTQSIEGSPGSYSVNLQLTKAKRKTDKFLRQEQFLSSTLWREISSFVYSHLLKQKVFLELNIATYALGIQEQERSKNWIRRRLSGTYFEKDVPTYDRNSPVPGIDFQGYTSYIIDLFESNVQSKMFDPHDTTYISEGTFQLSPSAALRQAESTGKGIPVCKLKSEPIAKALYNYGAVLTRLVDSKVTPTEMIILGIPDNIIQQIMQVRQLNSSQVHSTYNLNPVDLTFARTQLQTFWADIYKDQVFLDPMFSDLAKRIATIEKQFTHGSPCYPDLNLPQHPLSHDVLDTPPDFWFWNESIDGAHFLTAEDSSITQEAKNVMTNSYESMRKFTAKDEYEKTYFSQNRDILDKYNKNNVTTLSYDEHGFKTPAKYNVTMDKEIMELLMKAPTANNLKLSSTPAYFKPGDQVKFGSYRQSELEPPVIDDKHSITDGTHPRLQETLDGSIKNFDSDVFNLARAFPTFKIYFIEEDDLDKQPKLGVKNFDDFYSYSAIKDIRIVRSRKLPADLCVISITNIYGELDTLMYAKDTLEGTSARITEKFDITTVNTELENPFSRLVLMEGNKVKVKLGYSNDPNELETVFLGQVVEVGVSPISSDIIQLVCQSYGVELVSELKSGGSFGDTQSLLSTLICSGECKHFGKWEPSITYDPASVRASYSSDSRWGILGLGAAVTALKKTALTAWNFSNDPQDDNIFAPDISTYTDNSDGFVDKAKFWFGIGFLLEWTRLWVDDRKYYPWHSTIWDIFQEMELRHPGYVSLAVPYGERYTMFFGPPSHSYWSRPLTTIELGGWQKYNSIMDSIKNQISNKKSNFTLSPSAALRQVESEEVQSRLEENEGNYHELIDLLLLGRGSRYKPFRNYFFLSSNHNIIANNMSISSHGTFNAINLTYMNNAINLNKQKTDREGRAPTFAQVMQQEGKNLEMKADDNIEDRYTRVMTAQYATCFGEFFARRYAISLLMKSLRDVYKGEVTVMGIPKIKPYDVCMIYDTYRDIYGPVEVKQITHIFSPETGFITQIQPDMVISHNAWSTECTFDAMLSVGANLFNSVMDRFEGQDVPERSTAQTLGAVAVGIGAAIPAGGLGAALMLLGGWKILNWSQGRHPIMITPLCHGPKPWFAGIDGYKHDTLMLCEAGRLKRWVGNAAYAIDDIIGRSVVKNWFLRRFADIVNK